MTENYQYLSPKELEVRIKTHDNSIYKVELVDKHDNPRFSVDVQSIIFLDIDGNFIVTHDNGNFEVGNLSDRKRMGKAMEESDAYHRDNQNATDSLVSDENQKGQDLPAVDGFHLFQ